MFALINLEMKRFIEVASYNFVNMKVYRNLPGMHARNDISLNRNFSGFFTCMLQIFRFDLPHS